jgi:DNA-3-methyladenine glycosylase II
MRIATLQTARLCLTPTMPYDFALAVSYLRTAPSALLERIGDDGIYERALRLEGIPALVRVTSATRAHSPQLDVEVHGERVSDAMVAAAERLVHRIFLLDEDPAGFFALAARDPVLGALLARLPGVRPVLIADPFEALLWAIIGQQITVAFARKLKLALVALAGETIALDGYIYTLPLEPARVASLTAEALRAAQFSRQKIAYMLALAQAVTSGELRMEELDNVPPEEAQATLLAYKGIGRWTAEYVLIRAYGARDSIPAADAGLRAVIGRAYGLGRSATETEVRERAEAWAGWRGWAAFVWWLALQLKLS